MRPCVYLGGMTRPRAAWTGPIAPAPGSSASAFGHPGEGHLAHVCRGSVADSAGPPGRWRGGTRARPNDWSTPGAVELARGGTVDDGQAGEHHSGEGPRGPRLTTSPAWTRLSTVRVVAQGHRGRPNSKPRAQATSARPSLRASRWSSMSDSAPTGPGAISSAVPIVMVATPGDSRRSHGRRLAHPPTVPARPHHLAGRP